MPNRSFKFKFLAGFVLAFICLNAGGAVCVAYCQSFGIAAAAESEHCPLKKASAVHCDKSQDDNDKRDSMSVAADIECCPMTVSFFAAPVEKNSLSFAPAPTAAATVRREVFKPLAHRNESLALVPNYRGPPPLDRRIERIKHALLRI